MKIHDRVTEECTAILSGSKIRAAKPLVSNFPGCVSFQRVIEFLSLSHSGFDSYLYCNDRIATGCILVMISPYSQRPCLLQTIHIFYLQICPIVFFGTRDKGLQNKQSTTLTFDAIAIVLRGLAVLLSLRLVYALIRTVTFALLNHNFIPQWTTMPPMASMSVPDGV
jgi:hypothetical protein